MGSCNVLAQGFHQVFVNGFHEAVFGNAAPAVPIGSVKDELVLVVVGHLCGKRLANVVFTYTIDLIYYDCYADC